MSSWNAANRGTDMAVNNDVSTLTSTTAPGKLFTSRAQLANHYKSDWHKYNLKRREAGLPLLGQQDFEARLEAALALKREREGKQERSGTNHLKRNKGKKSHKEQQKHQHGGGGSNTAQVTYDHIKPRNSSPTSTDKSQVLPNTAEDDAIVNDETRPSQAKQQQQQQEEEPPVIEPRQCLFDKHMSPSVQANVERMQRKYGFFVPDQEYLVDLEGMIGYCQEKVKLGHYCLYCQRIFSTWQGCQKHMIAKRHTKLKYEAGIDLEEYEPFYDFAAADEEFLGMANAHAHARAVVADQDESMGQAVSDDDDDDDGSWEDVTDDELEEDLPGDEEVVEVMDEDHDEDDAADEGLYAGYQDEIAKYGFDVTPLGELVFPDGRIVGHRGLARYYKQRINPHQETAAVVAARRAAGERMYNGRVYSVNRRQEERTESALTLARAGVAAGASAGQGNGILVASKSGGGFTAVSLYRYRAVVKKARRDDARGQRLQNKTRQNINKMDKKANRLMNNQSVAHAKR